eukprot:TRINITY_DN359_c0_g3_i1.p1 TRINITY_DN359_c0_g3~~TRINITY_DN359_c0_g3_i1.p1  ORF type:complete len:420 (+),score=88.41 TRINITY_DN359_c0_g3_i1:111-1370(+)
MKILVCLFISLIFSVNAYRFNYEDFCSWPLLLDTSTTGSVYKDGSDLVLVDTPNQASTVIFPTKVAIVQRLDSTFEFSIQGDVEGLSFMVIRKDADKPELIGVGKGGSGLGYQGISDSFIVEVDMKQNYEMEDPPSPHMSFHSDSIGKVSAKETAPAMMDVDQCSKDSWINDQIPYLKDGKKHTLSFRYANHKVSAIIDEDYDSKLECVYNLEHILDGTSDYDYVLGISAATGSSIGPGKGIVKIHSWTTVSGESMACIEGFKGNLCTVDPSAIRTECIAETKCNKCVESRMCCNWCKSPQNIKQCAPNTDCVNWGETSSAKCSADEGPSGGSTSWFIYFLLILFLATVVFAVVGFLNKYTGKIPVFEYFGFFSYKFGYDERRRLITRQFVVYQGGAEAKSPSAKATESEEQPAANTMI